MQAKERGAKLFISFPRYNFRAPSDLFKKTTLTFYLFPYCTIPSPHPSPSSPSSPFSTNPIYITLPLSSLAPTPFQSESYEPPGLKLKAKQNKQHLRYCPDLRDEITDHKLMDPRVPSATPHQKKKKKRKEKKRKTKQSSTKASYSHAEQPSRGQKAG